MLIVYVRHFMDFEDVEIYNDYFFNKNTYNKVISSSDLKNIIERVEGVIFEGNLIISKSTKMPIDLAKISTGCKTLLNIITYPDKIFTLDECGENIINEVFALNNRIVQISSFMLPEKEFKQKVKIIANDDEIIVNNLLELKEWFYDKYNS